MTTQIYQEAKTLVCQTLEITEAELSDEARLIDDLGCDSILIIELKTRFEEKYGIEIEPEDLDELVTLREIVQYLTNRGVITESSASS